MSTRLHRTASPEPPRAVRALLFLGHLWPTLVSGLGAICLALPALVNRHGRVAIPLHPRQGLILSIGAVLTVIGIVAAALRQRRVEALERQLLRAETQAGRAQRGVEELARLELATLARQLDYWSTERISLFAFVGSGFDLVARFTDNPILACHDRRRYPLEYGCLGQAWRGEERAVVVIRERRAQQPEQWAAAHEQTGMPTERVAELRMPSRTVVALRVDEPGVNATPLGVIVLESERTSDDEAVGGKVTAQLDPDELSNVIDRYNDTLAEFLAVLGRLTVVAAGTAA